MADTPERLDRVSARAGTTNHVTRFVLGISLVLVIVAFALLLAYWA